MDKLLTQFVAVAEAGSLSGAAAALYVTQPTLSFNMRKLEDTVGAALFERSSLGVRLTPYGQTLYENARLMRRLYDNALTAIADQKLGAERGLAIGSGYSWWTLFLKDMVVDYQRQYPRSPVTVSLGNQLLLLDQMLSGDITLFLATELEGLGGGAEMAFIPFTRVYNAFFVRAGHPLLGAPRSPAEVDAWPLVTSAPPQLRHARLLAGRRGARLPAQLTPSHTAFSSNSLAACIDYTLETDAVLTHSDMLRDSLAARGLYEVELAELPPLRPVGIYCLSERRADPRVAELIERIVAAASAALPPRRTGANK